MTPQERQEFELLKALVFKLVKEDRYTFERLVEMGDGKHIQLGRSNGTKIGTATDQKLGFFAKTPVLQQTAPAALTESGGDSDATARAAINVIRTALVNLGLIA